MARINGELVSLAVLRQAAALLIDIHGQHEHQSLLHKDKHLAILDQFAREEMAPVRDALKDSYREYMILKKEMDGAITDEGKRLSEISFLQYQIEEIENAKNDLSKTRNAYVTGERFEDICYNNPEGGISIFGS